MTFQRAQKIATDAMGRVAYCDRGDVLYCLKDFCGLMVWEDGSPVSRAAVMSDRWTVEGGADLAGAKGIENL